MENKSNLETVKRKLDEVLGDSEKELLEDVLVELKKHSKAFRNIKNEELKQVLNQILKTLNRPKEKPLTELDVNLLNTKDLKNVIIEKLPEDFPKEFRLLEKDRDLLINAIKQIVIKNKINVKQPLISIPQQEPPKVIVEKPENVTVKTIKKIEHINKPDWYEQITKEQLDKSLEKIIKKANNNGLKLDLDRYRDASRAIAVRLSDGRKWINELIQAVGNYGTQAFPFRDENGRAKEATIDTSGNLKVSLSGDVQIGAVEIKDGDSDTKLDVESDGTKNAAFVQANDLDIRNLDSANDSVDATISSSALPTGAATSAKQDSLLTELQLKADLTETQPVQEVQPTGINGGDVSVGTSEVEMTFTGIIKSLMIQSKVDNTGSIWIGLTGVTNTGGNAFAQLSPGQSVSIDFNDTSSAIFAISDTAAQTVYKVALT